MASLWYGVIVGGCHPFSAVQSTSKMWSVMLAPNTSVSFFGRIYHAEVQQEVGGGTKLD